MFCIPGGDSDADRRFCRLSQSGCPGCSVDTVILGVLWWEGGDDGLCAG